MMKPDRLRFIAVLCWAVAFVSAILAGNYFSSVLLFINLILGLVVMELADRSIGKLIAKLKIIAGLWVTRRNRERE